MRKRSTKERPGQVGDYWLSKKPGRGGLTDSWCRTWFDTRTRQTCRLSLGTTDFHEASVVLANWVVANASANRATPEEVLIESVILSYWENHGKKLISAKTEWYCLSRWVEFWRGRTVADLTPYEQQRFRQWLMTRGIGEGGIDRILSSGRAALKRAFKWQELSEAPHIFFMQTAIDRRARKPMGRPITPKELAQMLDATRSRHMLVYLIIAANTLARPGAVLDLRRSQFDEMHKLLDLNPPGRRQNKKFRPIIPVSKTLLPWLSVDRPAQARYVAHRSEPIQSISYLWHIAREAAGLDDSLSPYSMRHGMARELRKRRVPTEQISYILGHLPKGSAATTSIYAPYEPDFCAEAVTAIDDIMDEVRSHLKLVNIDQPVLDSATIAALAVKPRVERDTGVGSMKRDEIRFLILSGVPHREVVLRAGVSHGTVTLVRQQLRAEMPLYRNTESGLSVPFACRGKQSSRKKGAQPIEIIGGPGRIRTCDQAVMSGRL